MPGEISRSNPGPKGGVPLVPSWIEKLESERWYGLGRPMGAAFSECNTYRYFLWRVWDDNYPPLGCVLLNPSTADANYDDPTVARCTSRARDLRYGGLIVGNIYAFRATNPKDMRQALDKVGPENDTCLKNIATLCPTILLGWGAHTKPERPKAVIDMLRAHSSKPKLIHLGLTASGQPRHPLYIGYKTQYQEIV